MSQDTTHTQDSWMLKEIIGYSCLGAALIGGSFFIGRSLIRKARSTSEEKKTYEEGNAATYAKQLKMAFENDNWMGWGTDEEAIRKIIRAVPSKDEIRKIINSYQKLYARSLMKDMQEELQTSEYNEMLAIIAAKPEKGTAAVQIQVSQQQYELWAKRLRAAFEVTNWLFPGTDEDAIKTVFMELPTQSAFLETARAYRNLYGDELLVDLKSELEFWEFDPMMEIIKRKPKS